MKKVRLSSFTERASAIGLLVLVVLLIALIVIFIKCSVGYIILISICSAAAVALAAGYLYAVQRAAAEICGEGIVKVYGLTEYSESFSGASTVKTVEVSLGPAASRSILFCDAGGGSICAIPTMFTANSGAMAEAAAKELAEEAGLKFIPQLELWKYDREAKARHKAELKAEKKQKGGRRNGDSPKIEESNVNYDALDDER